ncbi:MAG: ADP-ribosylglycohydrolase family protein [Rhizobacter sp.]|nr:ADP-ribosylglycohydrolase family protein [Chlorobiales bacterium]
MTTEKINAFILGTLVGDALGLPANGRNHSFIRMYFKGIKGYTHEYYGTATATGLRAGQNSREVIPLLTSLPAEANERLLKWIDMFFDASVDAKKLLTHFFQALAAENSETLQPRKIIDAIFPETIEREKIISALDFFPADMTEVFNEMMTERDAVLFAITMALRQSQDFETTVLSAINMGGLTSLIGAITGGALALLHGKETVPQSFIDGLEHREEILAALQV